MNKDARHRTREPSDAKSGWGRIAPYALLSLGCFVIGLLLVVLLVSNARLLVSLGLEGRFYYLILLPLGLAVTGVLFGAFRSVALYRGQQFGGALELGGPIVGFALVMIGGFYLPPPASNFPLTVYLHGSGGPQDLPLRNHGKVLLDLGGDRRSEPIGDKGQAFFPEIPANFRGQKVNVALDVSGYERREKGPIQLDATGLYVEVRRKPTRIAGNVLDETGKPVVGATISVAGMTATSMEQGRFEFVLPSDWVQDEMVLRVMASGYQPWSQQVIPNGSAITTVLRR